MATKFPTNNLEWQRHIRHVAKDTDAVVLTVHVRDRMLSRSVLASEVYECLQHGEICRPPRKHAKSKMLICRMECDVNGRRLTVAVDVESSFPDGVITVTVID